MLLNLKPLVLIGASVNIKQKKLIHSKVGKILRDIDDFEIILIDDDSHFLSTVFTKNVVNTIPHKAKTRDITKIIKEVSHVILFWDGSDINEFVFRALLTKKKSRIVAVETTKVVNKDKGEPFDVYIGRGTPWGNPYAIGAEGMDREEVLIKYRKYFNEQILTDEKKVKDILTLKGKTLGCHCKPHACHGDIIAEFINTQEE